MRIANCELCKAEKLTRWYYEDNSCWVADCKDCNIPMVVLRRHGEASQDGLRHLEHIVEILFPGATVRKEQRKIKGHIHWHILERDRDGGIGEKHQ